MTGSGQALPSALEVAAIARRVAANGGFATVLRKGDPDRGMLVLIVTSRGEHVAVIERERDLDGELSWRRNEAGQSEGSIRIADFLEKRARFDPDFWVLELDIALPERFIEEIMVKG